jgi:hypothetical protein
MRGKLIHRTFSFFRTIKASVFRIVSLGGGLFAIWHYDENPVLTSFVFGFGLLIFLTAGDDEISIYEDRIKISGGSLWRAFRGKNSIPYHEIKAIDVTGTYDRKADLLDDLASLGPGHYSGWNDIKIWTIEGKPLTFRARIYREKIEEALRKIPSPFDKLASKR